MQPFIYFGSAGVLLTTKIDIDVEWFKVNIDLWSVYDCLTFDPKITFSNAFGMFNLW